MPSRPSVLTRLSADGRQCAMTAGMSASDRNRQFRLLDPWAESELPVIPEPYAPQLSV